MGNLAFPEIELPGCWMGLDVQQFLEGPRLKNGIVRINRRSTHEWSGYVQEQYTFE